ncbi:hypothetical protein TNCV_2164061 [Trichonephila clavipes]|nr:hypothetical protein TNCV_2164061 [Trichonephila clavipes]
MIHPRQEIQNRSQSVLHLNRDDGAPIAPTTLMMASPRRTTDRKFMVTFGSIYNRKPSSTNAPSALLRSVARRGLIYHEKEEHSAPTVSYTVSASPPSTSVAQAVFKDKLPAQPPVEEGALPTDKANDEDLTHAPLRIPIPTFRKCVCLMSPTRTEITLAFLIHTLLLECPVDGIRSKPKPRIGTPVAVL